MPKPTLWIALSETLRNEIADGHFGAGDKLPTEAELAARFNVNRHTVRRALAALVDAGLLRTRRGAGIFVQGRPTQYPIGKRVRFHENIHADGHAAEKRILALATRHASDQEAAALSIPMGASVHVYEGLSMVDQSPLALFTSVFPAKRFPDLLDALEKDTSVTKALKACGLADYLRRETRLVAKLATTIQANHLQCKVGAPVLRTTGINTDLDGAPVEYGQSWFVGDNVELIVKPDGI